MLTCSVFISDDSLSSHRNMQFSTGDKDHDTEPDKSCSRVYHGAWWYAHCHSSNLNGKYYKSDENVPAYNGIEWRPWAGKWDSLAKVSMKFRPTGFPGKSNNAGE